MEKAKSKNLCRVSLCFEAYDELLALIGVESIEDFGNLTDEEVVKRLHTIRLELNNHNELVEQNKSLQKTILKMQKGENDEQI